MYFHFSARTAASDFARWLPRLTSIDAKTWEAVTIGLPFSPIRYSVSFIAPYSFRVEPQIAMRKYFGMMAIW